MGLGKAQHKHSIYDVGAKNISPLFCFRPPTFLRTGHRTFIFNSSFLIFLAPSTQYLASTIQQNITFVLNYY